MQQNPSVRNSQSSISGALSAVRAGASVPAWPSVRGEDVGRSLAEMAQRDLDAALQLLADRAQFITGASGAAIALRREGMRDMLCRASTGSNAPELGALLSTEFGLSGESVRTKQLLRCDDAERDARVNREVCRQLGIASVVVMPVVHDDEVLGVFELFSGKTNAFGARDLSAVQRLGGMVETAVRLAYVTETLTEKLKPDESSPAEAKSAIPEVQAEEQILDEHILEVEAFESSAVAKAVKEDTDVLLAAADIAAEAALTTKKSVETSPGAQTAANADEKVAAPAKPLLWSAADLATGANKSEDADQSHVPPMLRGLRKCESCGFPISGGRVLCVECEEKKWRGQLKRPQPMPTGVLPQSSTSAKAEAPALGAAAVAPAKAASPPGTVAASTAAPLPAPSPATKRDQSRQDAGQSVSSSPVKATGETDAIALSTAAEAVSSTFTFSAGLEDSQSWIAANKYVIGVLVLVAVLVSAFFIFR